MPHGLSGFMACVSNICWLHGLSNCSFSNGSCLLCLVYQLYHNQQMLLCNLSIHTLLSPRHSAWVTFDVPNLHTDPGIQRWGAGCERHYTLSHHRVGFSPLFSYTNHQLPSGNFPKSVREMHSTWQWIPTLECKHWSVLDSHIKRVWLAFSKQWLSNCNILSEWEWNNCREFNVKSGSSANKTCSWGMVENQSHGAMP